MISPQQDAEMRPYGRIGPDGQLWEFCDEAFCSKAQHLLDQDGLRRHRRGGPGWRQLMDEGAPAGAFTIPATDEVWIHCDTGRRESWMRHQYNAG